MYRGLFSEREREFTSGKNLFSALLTSNYYHCY